MNRKALLIGLPVLALFTVAAVQQDGILLRRELKEGVSDKYRIDFTSDMNATVPGMGEQQIGMKGGMDYVVAIGKVDAEKGEADAEITTSNVSFELLGPMAGMMPPPPPSKDVTTKGKVDTRGRLIAAAASMDPQMMMFGGASMNSVGQGIEFPEKPVKVGDSWTVVLPKNPIFGNEEVKMTAKLLGETRVGGVEAYDVSLEGKIPTKIDMAELSKSMQDGDPTGGMMAGMIITGTMNVKTKGTFEKASGRTLKMESTIGNNMSLEVGGMQVPISGTMKVVMLLKK